MCIHTLCACTHCKPIGHPEPCLANEGTGSCQHPSPRTIGGSCSLKCLRKDAGYLRLLHCFPGLSPSSSCLLNSPNPHPTPHTLPSHRLADSGRGCTGPGSGSFTQFSQNPYTEIRKRCGSRSGRRGVKPEGQAVDDRLLGKERGESDHVKAGYSSGPLPSCSWASCRNPALSPPGGPLLSPVRRSLQEGPGMTLSENTGSRSFQHGDQCRCGKDLVGLRGLASTVNVVASFFKPHV